MRFTLVVSEGLQVADNLAIPSHLVRRAVLPRAGTVGAPEVDDVGAGAEARSGGERVGGKGRRARELSAGAGCTPSFKWRGDSLRKTRAEALDFPEFVDLGTVSLFEARGKPATRIATTMTITITIAKR